MCSLITRHLPVLLLWSCALGCDAEDSTAPVDTPVQASERPEAAPAEWAELTLRRSLDGPELETLFAPLRTGTGTIALSAGVSLAVEPDPATTERRIATLTLAPVGSGEPEQLVRVPMSATYLELFTEASLQGLLAVVGQETPSSFAVTYEVASPHGGELAFKVTPGRLEVRMRSPATSLTPETFGAPAPAGDAHEVVSAQVRMAIDYLTFRRLVRAVFDPASGGVAADLCGQDEAFTANAPHDWYDICIRVVDPQQPVQVDVDLHTRDGRRLPIARSPGSIRTATLWVAAIDRLAAAAALGAEAQVDFPVATFDYRDPDVQGGAVFRATTESGRVVFDHQSITPPSALPDVEPLLRSAARPEPPPPDDPCAAAGSLAAPAGQISVDVQLDDGVAVLGGFTLPLTGDAHASIYHAEDVSILGPREGTVALETFTIADLALDGVTPTGRYVSGLLPAGAYMVLGFFDVGGDSDPTNPRPLRGEPISLPLRRVELKCAAQPATLLFDATFPG